METALAQNATTAILAHNHITGLAIPSQADWLTTYPAAPSWLRGRHRAGGPPHLCGRRHGIHPGEQPV
ncbi:MAG: JAB domain-containing protein [Lawsonibacter sp.]